MALCSFSIPRQTSLLHATVLHPHPQRNFIPPCTKTAFLPFLAAEKEEEPFQLNRGRRKKSTCHPRITYRAAWHMISQCAPLLTLSLMVALDMNVPVKSKVNSHLRKQPFFYVTLFHSFPALCWCCSRCRNVFLHTALPTSFMQ